MYSVCERGLPPGGGWGGGFCMPRILYDVIPPHHQQPIRRAGERRGGGVLYRPTYTTCIRGGGGGRGQSLGQYGLLYSTPPPPPPGGRPLALHSSMSLGTYVCMFYAFFNHFYSSIFEIALWILRSLLLKSLKSRPLRARFCQFAQSAPLFASRSAIAPKMKVRSRAKSDWAISKSDMPSSEYTIE